MPHRPQLALIGPMGAGKSSIGRALAGLLERPFIDLDRAIEAAAGAEIPLIFEIEGEERFREREKAVIAELARRDDIVLATGGGAVLDPANRAALRAHGTVIYLRASIDDLLARTALDKNRPLLQTANPREKLESLFAVRDPLYREVADIVIDTSRQHVSTLVNRLLVRLQENPHS